MTNEHEQDDPSLNEFNEDAFFSEEPMMDESDSENMTETDEEYFRAQDSLGEKVKSLAVPVLIGGSIIAFAGFKLYNMFAPTPAPKQVTVPTFKEKTTSATPETAKVPAPAASTAEQPTPKADESTKPAVLPENPTLPPAASVQTTPASPTASQQSVPTESSAPHSEDAGKLTPTIPTTFPGASQLKAPETKIAPETAPAIAGNQSVQIDPLKQLLNTTAQNTANTASPVATSETQEQTYNTLQQYWQREQKDNAASKQLSAESPASEPVTTPSPVAEETRQQIQTVATKVGDLDQKITDINEGVNKLGTTLSNLEKTLSKLNSELVSFKQTQQQQTNQMTKLSSQLSLLSAAPEQKSSSAQSIITREMPAPSAAKTHPLPTLSYPPKSAEMNDAPLVSGNGYTVEAVIPGRAWLRTPDGITITVTEGDTLGNLGNVVMIDAQNGSIVTASGIILRD